MKAVYSFVTRIVCYARYRAVEVFLRPVYWFANKCCKSIVTTVTTSATHRIVIGSSGKDVTGDRTGDASVREQLLAVLDNGGRFALNVFMPADKFDKNRTTATRDNCITVAVAGDQTYCDGEMIKA